MKKPTTTLSFIYSVCKPYRKWYLIICIAPLSQGVLFGLNNYAIKNIIDTISGDISSYQMFVYPFFIFLIVEILTRFLWSLHDYGEYKIQGNVFADVILKPYKYLQNHSYNYFQNNFSGSITSKIKGISDGLYNFWNSISHNLCENISMIICNTISIAMISNKLLLPIILFTLLLGTLNYFQAKFFDKYCFELKQNWHIIVGKIADKIANIFVIFSFAKKEYEIEDIANFYKNIQTPLTNKLNYYNFLTWLLLGTIYSLSFLGIFADMIYLRKNGFITTGSLAIAFFIVLRSCHEIFSFSNNCLSFIKDFSDFRASLDGIFVEQNIIDKSDAKKLVI